jgi:hypothetical protein
MELLFVIFMIIIGAFLLYALVRNAVLSALKEYDHMKKINDLK